MFKINLSPKQSGDILTVVKSGNVLIINGTPYDFTTLNDGDEIPHDAIVNEWIVYGITKENGIINITITRPYSNINAPESVRFPMPIMLTEDQVITFNDENDMENNAYPVIELEPEE
ncbi:hypothetical protein ACLBWZ_03385 [Brucellaceae bacterium C25G]